jgi:predicted MFS family arabinose efflux permease
LQSAIRLNASSRNLSILLGPAVGGGLLLLLGPAWGLLANVAIYLPLTLLLWRLPYTGHTRHAGVAPSTRGFGLREAVTIFREARADRRVVTMIVLAGVTSFFVGSGFQPQMPEYAHDLGAEQADVWYSVLLAGNAAGALLGVLLLESLNVLRPSARAAIACAAGWAAAMTLFSAAPNYAVAVALLVLAGMLNVAFTSMAQTLVQVLAPPRLRGRMVGLFNASLLGLRVGSGVTIGVLGALIGIHWSLALSAAAVVLIALGLLAREWNRGDGAAFDVAREPTTERMLREPQDVAVRGEPRSGGEPSGEMTEDGLGSPPSEANIRMLREPQDVAGLGSPPSEANIRKEPS